MAITRHIGNESGSIWTTGTPGTWDEAMFNFRMPGNVVDWSLKAFVRNTNGQEVFVDDVRIERYKER